MNARTIVTSVLLAFIAVSIIYVLTSENSTDTTPASDKVVAEETKSKKCEGCSDTTQCEEKVDGEKTSSQHITTKDNVQAADEKKTKVIAYYFHGEVRCTTCTTIETFAKEAFNKSYKKDLATGALEFVEINIDDSKNEHYIEEYELASSSLVIAKFENGKRTTWKNLEKVWQLVHDKTEFIDYTTQETDKILHSKI